MKTPQQEQFRTEWESSYQNRDNFLFQPQEEIVRFVSKYIRKRVGIYEYINAHPHSHTPKILDVGCGIGRHVIYAQSMGLEAYGIDLSEMALQTAKNWAQGLSDEALKSIPSRLHQGDIQSLPWRDGFFDYAMSHGVLDSMPYDVACNAIAEINRVLCAGGLFYCDLISGDDSKHTPGYSGEEVVNSQHERGTIQSYFNFDKIKHLIQDKFEILEGFHIRRNSVLTDDFDSRFHLVLRKI